MNIHSVVGTSDGSSKVELDVDLEPVIGVQITDLGLGGDEDEHQLSLYLDGGGLMIVNASGEAARHTRDAWKALKQTK